MSKYTKWRLQIDFFKNSFVFPVDKEFDGYQEAVEMAIRVCEPYVTKLCLKELADTGSTFTDHWELISIRRKYLQ